MLTPRDAMTAALSAAEPPTASHAHYCLVCGAGAAFGFATRGEDVWTCAAHRKDGERLKVSGGVFRTGQD